MANTFCKMLLGVEGNLSAPRKLNVQRSWEDWLAMGRSLENRDTSSVKAGQVESFFLSFFCLIFSSIYPENIADLAA